MYSHFTNQIKETLTILSSSSSSFSSKFKAGLWPIPLPNIYTAALPPTRSKLVFTSSYPLPPQNYIANILTPTPVTKSMPRSTSSSIRCHFCLHHRRAFNIIFGRQCRTCYHRPCPKCATIGGESTDEVPPQPRPEEFAITRKSQQNGRKSH